MVSSKYGKFASCGPERCVGLKASMSQQKQRLMAFRIENLRGCCSGGHAPAHVKGLLPRLPSACSMGGVCCSGYPSP